MDFEIVPIGLLSDNYAYLIHAEGATVVVDPSEGPSVGRALEQRGWDLHAVVNTHHHWDHVGGNAWLKKKYACPVLVPKGDGERIEGADVELDGGQEHRVGPVRMRVLEVPGHTHHHKAFYLPEAGAVFTGDTLFLMGCGRLFEGTAAQMWGSLQALASLPPETRVYCGHEYTVANAEFALQFTSGDGVTQQRLAEARGLRARGLPTVPGTMEQERRTNPFLRILDPEFAYRHFAGLSPEDAFGQLRRLKDGR